jgi:hypothetical protein
MMGMDQNITYRAVEAEVASTQHGLITFDQAIAVGLSPQQVQRRVARGQWVRVHRGVYRVAGTPPSWHGAALAACLAAPRGAMTSHLTAAAVSGLGIQAPPRPAVTVEPGRSSRLPGVTVHRSVLPPEDCTVVQAIPTTTVARTLVDCAAILGPVRLQRLVDEAFHRQLVRPAQIVAVWDRVRRGAGRAGETRLRAAVEPWAAPITPGSPAELRLHQRLVQWGLPQPELQIVVRGPSGTAIARIDFGWSQYLVGIEYDSVRWHGASRWERDLAREQRLTAAGWVILRADKSDLEPGQHELERAARRALDGQADRLGVPRLV